MKNAETSQATLEKVREMRHRREHDESTTFDGLSHEDIWQIASLVESQAKRIEELEQEKKRMKDAIIAKRKELWSFYHECQQWELQKAVTKPLDDLLSSLSQ